MARDKIARRALRWVHRAHPDYVRASTILYVPERRALTGRLQVQAHRVRNPLKVSLSLLYQGERILALDIELGHFHRNILHPGESVNATHWQRWPDMDAERDERKLEYRQWFSEFLVKAKIIYNHPVVTPPHGLQLDLQL